jgi:hypothetical protein
MTNDQGRARPPRLLSHFECDPRGNRRLVTVGDDIVALPHTRPYLCGVS